MRDVRLFDIWDPHLRNTADRWTPPPATSAAPATPPPAGGSEASTGDPDNLDHSDSSGTTDSDNSMRVVEVDDFLLAQVSDGHRSLFEHPYRTR